MRNCMAVHGVAAAAAATPASAWMDVHYSLAVASVTIDHLTSDH